MKHNSIRRTAAAMLTLVLALTVCSGALGCTTVIVGKDVSADGSAFFGRTVDTHGLVGAHITAVPATEGEGTVIFTDPANGLVAELPAAGCQYFMTNTFESAGLGIFGESGGNEYNVFMSSTETLIANDTALSFDPYVPDGVAECNIPTLVLPYIRTAREGVERLGALVTRYGSAESNGVVFGDDNEVWYIEIYTGHQWAAVKCPDDRYAVIANDALLGWIDLDDKENVIACDTILSLPREKGFLREVDGRFHLAATYNEDLRDYSQIRVWAGMRQFSPSIAGEYDVSRRWDIFAVPDEKIRIDDVMEYMRYRLEGTEYSCDIPGNNYRPVGIERTATTHLFQIRPGKPTVSWISLANPEFSVFMPLYENLNSVPACYALDSTEYTDESAWWIFREVSSLATLDRAAYGAPVRQAYKALEEKWLAGMDAMDKAYADAGYTPEAAAALFEQISGEALGTAKRLETELLTQIATDITKRSDTFGQDKPAE